jgi:hypothetical protein
MTTDQYEVIEALYLRDDEDGAFRRALDHAYAAGLAAQEARAQRVEQAARVLVLAWESIVLDPDTQEGLLMDLRDALSQPADERGHDYENDGNGVCVHCGYKVVPAQPAATGEGEP